MLSGPQDAIDLKSIRRVLVIKLRHHGDVLLTGPVFSVLQAHAPHLEIDALVYAETRDMLALHPAVSQIHCIERSWKTLGLTSRIAAEWALFSRLRRRGYDLLIHLTEHGRGAWLARTLGCGKAVAPGYRSKSKLWKKSFTHRYSMPLNARRHMVELNLDALRRIGVQPAVEERRLTLVAGHAAEAEADAVLGEQNLQAGGFLHVHPTSRWQFKCWPPLQVAQMLDALAAQGHRLVITAAPVQEEAEFVAQVLANVRTKPVDLSGRLSLKGLAALSAKSRLFIGVDSAPMHIAAAMGRPVVALFGPSGEAEWGPWSVPHRIVSSQVHACRPCGIDGCGGGKVSDCLTTLPVGRVLTAVDQLLAGSG